VYLETSNLVCRLLVASTGLLTTNHPWKGRDQGHMTHFTPREISLQLLQIETSNFVHEFYTWNISPLMNNCPASWRGQDQVTHFLEFCTPWNISGTTKARDFKFRTLVAAWSISLAIPDYPTSGRGQGHVTHFCILGPDHIFGADCATSFKFGCRLNRKSTCITRLKVLQYGVHLGSQNDLLFFCGDKC